MLMGQFAGPDRPADLSHAELPYARAVDASAAVVVPGRALAEEAFTPGHVAPMTQVNGTNERMTQVYDA
jgi:hypothetical protein